MELLTHRYRTLTVLLLVIAAQILLLGYQVRSREEVRLVRVWAVSAITPAARLLESGRSGIASLLDTYVTLIGVHHENERLKEQLDQLKQERIHLRHELAAAERASGMGAFQERSPSKTVAARIIGTDPAPDAQVVYIDRGSSAGIERGMALITPDGIVGKILAVYPASSKAVLVRDPSFAAGVISQKNGVQGTLRGQGRRLLIVDHVEKEEKLEKGEWFYTTGDDRVFPRGLPVGVVQAFQDGPVLKEIFLSPSALLDGLEEVLVVLEASHQQIPPVAAGAGPHLLPPPGIETDLKPSTAPGSDQSLGTDADRILDRYRRVGAAQGHVFGAGSAPDLNYEPGQRPAAAGQAGENVP